MAFQEVTNTNTIKSYWPKKASERQKGDTVVGVYRSSLERKNPDGSTSKLYLLDTEDGTVGVNSYAAIDRAMEQIPQGSTVKIVYDGDATSKKTGRRYINFHVYMDTPSTEGANGEEEPAGDTVDVSEVPQDF